MFFKEKLDKRVLDCLSIKNSKLPNLQNWVSIIEKQKLGDNAQARIERVDLWAKANLTESSYESIVRNANSGDFILAMEELINKASPADIEGQNDVQNIGPLTRDELETMMKDPRYRDPRHRDPSFVRRVEEGFKTLKS